MDGGASGHLKQDVECATVPINTKLSFLILLCESSSKSNNTKYCYDKMIFKLINVRS